MPEFKIHIRSKRDIKAAIVGHNEGRFEVTRSPSIGYSKGMGYGGAEILSFAAATCLYNNIQREAKQIGIELDAVEVEATATWDEGSLVAKGIELRPHVEGAAPADELQDLVDRAFSKSSVANTVSEGVPVELSA